MGTQNIEIQLGFVAFLRIRDFAQVGGAVENLYNYAMVRPRGITHVVLGNAIFVEDFRVPEGPGAEVRADASRVSPNRSFGERVLKLFSTPFGSGRPFGC